MMALAASRNTAAVTVKRAAAAAAARQSSGSRLPLVARCPARTQVAAPPAWRRATAAAYSTGHFTEFVLSTEDRLEIIDLCHRFDHLLNAGHQDKLGDLFAPDAQVITPKGTVQGIKPILEYFQSCKPLAQGNRHLTCDILVQPDGVRSARASGYRLLHKACCPPVLLASGTIEDRLVSIDGEWRFSQRVFVMDPPAAQQPGPQEASTAVTSSTTNGKH